MKLSKKINLILLPVMLAVFSIAGFYSYSTQKQLVTTSVSDRLKQELVHISDELSETVSELNFFSSLLLDSNAVSDFLSNSEETKYHLEKQLVSYIKQLNINGGDLASFGLLDKNSNEVFFADFTDPFATFEYSEKLREHLSYLTEEIKDVGFVNLSTIKYDFHQHNTVGEKVVLIRTFSLNQPISNTYFSSSQEIYTAVITLNTDKIDEHLSTLKDTLGADAKFQLAAQSEPHTGKNESIVWIATEQEYGLSLSNEFWQLRLAITQAELASLYKPYKQLYTVIVLLVTVLTFTILKWLITKQIIQPVVRLTNQVEKAGTDKKINLCRPKGDDEVSLLTHKYLDLIVELDDLAKRDHLTGLPNRNQFNADLNRFVERSIKNHETCAVIYFDLDNFKSVNDLFGHHTGDEILKEFSKRLVESSVDLDWDNIEIDEFEFARISGDEFTIILSGIKDLDVLALFAQKILSLFDGGFRFNDNLFDLGASIGIAVCPNDARDATTLVNYADMAMYAAKKERKNGYKFYSNEIDSEVKRHELIATQLRRALNQNEFQLLYMPVFNTETGEVCGAEALLRATSEELASVGPAEFIPVAETSGIIEEIDYWVIESSLRQLSVWIEELNFDGVLAINFSSWQLKNPEFVSQVASLLEQFDVPPSQVELEITETCFVPGESRNEEMLTELHNLGVKLSLDDFGTGFTAFSQLTNYPVDTLKVDRMFVNAIDAEGSENRSLVDMIAQIAKLYDLNVIAEGVETQTQLEHIRNIGCQQVQGFLLSKPLTEDKFREIWKSQA